MKSYCVSNFHIINHAILPMSFNFKGTPVFSFQILSVPPLRILSLNAFFFSIGKQGFSFFIHSPSGEIILSKSAMIRKSAVHTVHTKISGITCIKAFCYIKDFLNSYIIPEFCRMSSDLPG